MSVFPTMGWPILPANRNWTSTGKRECELEASLECGQRGPWLNLITFLQYQRRVSPGQDDQYSATPGQLKMSSLLIYTWLVNHDIIIEMHYIQGSHGYILEPGTIRCWKPTRALILNILLYCSQTKRGSNPSCIMAIVSLRSLTQNMYTHHEFQGIHKFAVAALLRWDTWQSSLHTYSLLASAAWARFCVFWCRRIHGHTLASEARQEDIEREERYAGV